MRARATQIMMICRAVMVRVSGLSGSCGLAILTNSKVVFVKSKGMDFEYGKMTRVRLSMSRPQPRAVMMAETRGAVRSGR